MLLSNWPRYYEGVLRLWQHASCALSRMHAEYTCMIRQIMLTMMMLKIMTIMMMMMMTEIMGCILKAFYVVNLSETASTRV